MCIFIVIGLIKYNAWWRLINCARQVVIESVLWIVWKRFIAWIDLKIVKRNSLHWMWYYGFDKRWFNCNNWEINRSSAGLFICIYGFNCCTCLKCIVYNYEVTSAVSYLNWQLIRSLNSHFNFLTICFSKKKMHYNSTFLMKIFWKYYWFIVNLMALHSNVNAYTDGKETRRRTGEKKEN